MIHSLKKNVRVVVDTGNGAAIMTVLKVTRDDALVKSVTTGTEYEINNSDVIGVR